MSNAFQSDGLGDSDGLPKWACPRCGKKFEAITQAQLDRDADNHLLECDGLESGNSGEGLEDAQYRISVPVYPPRDADQYALTPHFQHARKRRKEPEVTPEVIEEVIAQGQIKHTHRHDRFMFEHWIDGWDWKLIVAVRDEAFLNVDEKHIAVTIFAENSDQHTEVTKYV